mmetsp:Transcript_12522/g.34423  ORF Transcript_12522/g.34423 Transcript_12522/m.34423 type:complete len:96 (+) Transcript_12522:445-732(+)
MWPEYVCGTDKYGHFIQSLRASEIDTDGLVKIDENQLFRLQGQRMRAYSVFKQELSKRSGVQRSVLYLDDVVESSYYIYIFLFLILDNAGTSTLL